MRIGGRVLLHPALKDLAIVLPFFDEDSVVDLDRTSTVINRQLTDLCVGQLSKFLPGGNGSIFAFLRLSCKNGVHLLLVILLLRGQAGVRVRLLV